jgi:hypothetical protein
MNGHVPKSKQRTVDSYLTAGDLLDFWESTHLSNVEPGVAVPRFADTNPVARVGSESGTTIGTTILILNSNTECSAVTLDINGISVALVVVDLAAAVVSAHVYMVITVVNVKCVCMSGDRGKG